MKLHSKGKLVRWAYLWVEDYDLPVRTNVCVLFWRIFLLTPIKCVAIAAMFALFSPYMLFAWMDEKGYLSFLHRPIRLPSMKFPSLPGKEAGKVAWQRAKDWKAGVCSIVEIER